MSVFSKLFSTLSPWCVLQNLLKIPFAVPAIFKHLPYHYPCGHAKFRKQRPSYDFSYSTEVRPTFLWYLNESLLLRHFKIFRQVCKDFFLSKLRLHSHLYIFVPVSSGATLSQLSVMVFVMLRNSGGLLLNVSPALFCYSQVIWDYPNYLQDDNIAALFLNVL